MQTLRAASLACSSARPVWMEGSKQRGGREKELRALGRDQVWQGWVVRWVGNREKKKQGGT